MARPTTRPTGRERTFQENEIIVSKTDTRGLITYANSVFIRVSGFEEEELLGAPHNLIRHPDMPRCVFQLLWNTISAGDEIFAYVVNLCKNGDHYWVLAHVTPSFNSDGRIIGYHSSRRVPSRAAIEQIEPVYQLLKQTEDSYEDWRVGMAAATELLTAQLNEIGKPYEEFVFSLETSA